MLDSLLSAPCKQTSHNVGLSKRQAAMIWRRIIVPVLSATHAKKSWLWRLSIHQPKRSFLMIMLKPCLGCRCVGFFVSAPNVPASCTQNDVQSFDQLLHTRAIGPYTNADEFICIRGDVRGELPSHNHPPMRSPAEQAVSICRALLSAVHSPPRLVICKRQTIRPEAACCLAAGCAWFDKQVSPNLHPAQLSSSVWHRGNRRDPCPLYLHTQTRPACPRAAGVPASSYPTAAAGELLTQM